MRFRLPLALLGAAGLALAGCVSNPARPVQVDPRIRQNVAAVRLDPAHAAALVSAWRAAHGLPAVRLDGALNAMAQRQADAMAAGDTISHDAAGSFAARLRSAGVDTVRAGENLGGGYFSVEEAIAAWRNSPDHNVNLLMPQARRFGIAIAKDPRTRFRVFWAMVVAADPEQPAVVSGLVSATGGPVLAPKVIRVGPH